MQKKGVRDKHLYFKALLNPIYEEGAYDFCILDMSPSKSVLNTAVMSTATYHVIITQSEVLSMEMIDKYMGDIQELQYEHNIESEILGISICMKDKTKLNEEVISTIEKHFGSLVFNTKIKRISRINDFVAFGYPDKNQKGLLYSKDRMALRLHNQFLDELLNKLELPLRKVGESNE